jgi:multisubunit Na+/H+ antiporter MnhG subunit
LSVRDYVVYALIASGVAAELVCCLGALTMRNALDRLHYAGAATTVGPALVAGAIVAREGLISIQGLNAVAASAFLLAGSPALTSATARAIRLRERGTLESTAAERRR